LSDEEGITVLRVGPIVVVDVIVRKWIVVETVLPGIKGAPGGSREKEAGMIVSVRRVWGEIGSGVVTDGLCVGGLVVWVIVDYAGTVEEFNLGSITSGIVLIGGMMFGGGIESVCGKREI
jgi:hypothetical protein